MGTLVLNGATSGSTTLQPTDATTQTITLPANSGTVITTQSSGKVIPTAALPAGSVLQVVSATYSTATSTTSTSYVATPLTATITPSSATSKILILLTAPYNNPAGSAGAGMEITIFRGSISGTNLGQATYGFGALNTISYNTYDTFSGSYYDSPATSSAQTYTVGFRTENAANTAWFCALNAPATITLMEIAA